MAPTCKECGGTQWALAMTAVWDVPEDEDPEHTVDEADTVYVMCVNCDRWVEVNDTAWLGDTSQHTEVWYL